jgi:hypothetical protein
MSQLTIGAPSVVHWRGVGYRKDQGHLAVEACGEYDFRKSRKSTMKQDRQTPQVPSALRRYTLDPDWSQEEADERRRRRALEEFVRVQALRKP